MQHRCLLRVLLQCWLLHIVREATVLHLRLLKQQCLLDAALKLAILQWCLLRMLRQWCLLRMLRQWRLLDVVLERIARQGRLRQ